MGHHRGAHFYNDGSFRFEQVLDSAKRGDMMTGQPLQKRVEVAAEQLKVRGVISAILTLDVPGFFQGFVE